MTNPQADAEPADSTPEGAVAANIRTLRTRLGISQAELSKRVTESGSRLGEMPIWGIENGKRRINVDDLYVLADALGVTVQHLLAPGGATEIGAGAQQYEITFAGGVTETVLAFRREVSEGWMNFYFGGELVYSAAVAHVLGIRLAKGAAS
jgi:transcriptional regulator with XRE-family HTH domain